MDSVIFESEPISASAIHIDTVKLSHAYCAVDLPPPNKLERRGFEINFKRRGNNEIINASLRPANKKITLPSLRVTKSEYGYCGISAEVSIAKLVNGNGLGQQTNEDIECGLDAIEDYIREKVGVEFDARTAKVNRFDVNADFLVGESQITPFINSIYCCDARLKRGAFDTTTVQFFNDSRTLIAYGKKSQMEADYRKGKATIEDVIAAEGLLRVESRLKTNQSVARFAGQYGLANEAYYLLHMPLANILIQRALSLLNLDTPKSERDNLDERLIKIFGGNAPEYLGIIEYCARYGERFWKKLGWSQATYYRKIKPLRLNHLLSISIIEELPALIIPSANNNTT
jgi:hypothetical protein